MDKPPEQSNASEDFSEGFGEAFGKPTDPTKPRTPRVSPKPKKAKTDQRRMASVNLTDLGFEALGALQKKTRLSRKEIISRALIDTLTGTMNETIVKFKFAEPLQLVELRKDVIALEASAEAIREGLYSIRPRSVEAAAKIAHELKRIQELLIGMEFLTREIKVKHKLLSGLTAADHKAIPELLPWLDGMRRNAEGKSDKAKRLSRYDLIERLVRLAV